MIIDDNLIELTLSIVNSRQAMWPMDFFALCCGRVTPKEDWSVAKICTEMSRCERFAEIARAKLPTNAWFGSHGDLVSWVAA